MITIRLHDGRTVQVQTDDPNKAAKVAHDFGQANPHPEHSSWNTVAGLAGNYLDGMLPGAAGAVRGARQAVVNAVQAPFSSSVDFHPLRSYHEGQAFQEARQKAASAAHPDIASAAQAAGIVGGFALPATKVARAATLGQKVLAGVKTAGAYGALSGAMSSKADTLPGMFSDALSSGALSAATGAALPVAAKLASAAAAPFRPITQPAGRMIGRGLQGLGDMLPGSVNTVLHREGQQLARDPARAAANVHLDREIRAAAHPVTGRPLRPTDLPAEVARRQALGVPAIAADISDGLRGRFSSAARSPGTGTMRVRQVLDERKQQEAARTAQHVAQSLGPVTNVERQADALNDQARRAARPLYDLAHAQPIPVTRELQELFSRPAGRKALDGAAVSLQNEGSPILTHGMIEGEDGVWKTGQVPTMAAYDHAKTALDDVVFAGSSPFKTAETSRDTRGAHTIRARLLAIMDGNGSGQRAAPPPSAPVVNPSAATAGLPVAPPALGNRFAATSEAEIGPWTGQRLQHPEGPEAAFADPAAERVSSIPPEGLNPFWKAARDAYAGPVQNRKALELGDDMAKAGATDVANRMEGMTGSQLDHFRLGHRTAIATDTRALPDYADAARRVAGSEEQRQAVAAVHGPEAAQALMDRLGPERDAAATWSAMRGGPAAGGLELSAQDRRIEDGAHGLVQVLAGHPGAGIGNIIRAVARGDRGGQAANGHIASVLAEPDVRALSDAMRDVGREKARRAAVERNRGRALQRGSRFLGDALGTNMIAPPPGDDKPAY